MSAAPAGEAAGTAGVRRETGSGPALIALIALVAGLLLYGGLSAPAPPAVRWVEGAIGALLVMAVGWRRPLLVVTGRALCRPGLPRWEAVAVLALSWLLWVPLLRGAALGWAPADVMRDVVPLLYLFLPPLLVPALHRNHGMNRGGPARWAVHGLAGGLVLAGLLLTLRWWKHARWGFGAVGARAMEDGGAYLLNAPSVLFAAVALPGLAIALLARGGVARWLAAPLCAAGGALCLGALAGAVHRTALGLAALSLVAITLWWVRRRPWLAPFLLVAAVAAVTLAGGAMAGAWDQVAEKTRLTGANTRWEEAAAVIAHAGAGPWVLLLGDGWGARIANPAVGGRRVGYTHTLASYALFKTGLLGTLALGAYLVALLRPWRRLLTDDPPLAWALLPPLLMALGLHTSFKYLDTGVMLSLLLLAAGGRKGLS